MRVFPNETLKKHHFILVIVLALVLFWCLSRKLTNQALPSPSLGDTRQPDAILVQRQRTQTGEPTSVGFIPPANSGSNATGDVDQRVRQRLAEIERGKDQWRG